MVGMLILRSRGSSQRHAISPSVPLLLTLAQSATPIPNNRLPSSLFTNSDHERNEKSAEF
jgi:hypothetical protein